MSNNIPEKVEVNTEDGVDPQSLVLAKQFMTKVGDLGRLTRRRGQLSHLYLCTMASWADRDVLDDVSKQRHFSQILYALGHGLHVVRVVGDGRSLVWNRYRDNAGNEVDREDSRYQGRRGNSRSDDRRPARYQKGGDGDRRNNGDRRNDVGRRSNGDVSEERN